MDQSLIYLDNHATTRCDPRVIEAMLPYFSLEYGNAHSLGHNWGEAARAAVDLARNSIAAVLGAAPDEIVFTSGATESNNLAIRGVAERPRRRGSHMVASAIEHPSILAPLERLAKQGIRTTLVGVALHGSVVAGRIDIDQLESALCDETCLVSIMLANNEMGAIEPLDEVSRLCRARGIPLHCDATQIVGKLPVDVAQLGVDLLSFTAHKFYGPKGIGALYIRSSGLASKLSPLIAGGGQQDGRRGGTLNVPAIVGMARALEICQAEMVPEARRLAELRNRYAELLLAALPGAEICGPRLDAPETTMDWHRLPHNLNLLLPGIDGQSLLLKCPQIGVSSGAACSSSSPEPSHVLRALGLDDDRVRSSLRLGLGRFNTADEVPRAVDAIAAAARELRAKNG